MNIIQIPVPKPDSKGLLKLASSEIRMQSQTKLRISIGISSLFSNARSLGYFGIFLFIVYSYLNLLIYRYLWSTFYIHWLFQLSMRHKCKVNSHDIKYDSTKH